MRKKTKRAVSAICAAAILLSAFAGCQSKKDDSSAASKADSKASSATEAKEYTQASPDKAPTLVWWQIGTPPENLKDGLENMNKYTAEKYGIKLDLKVADWGAWDQKMNTIVNSNEAFDMMFTNCNKYNMQVSQNAFADITNLVQKQAPDLYKLVPQEVWDGVKINGKIYSVPTYKDTAMTQYYVLDDAYVQKYNIDLSKIKTLKDLDKPFHDIKKGEGKKCYPALMDQGGVNGFFNGYDDMAVGAPVGVKCDDASRKVVYTWDQPEVVENLKLLHKWFKEGIINPSAPTLQSAPAKKIFFSAQAFPGAEVGWQKNAGVKKYDIVQVFGPMYTIGGIQGSLNAVSKNSEHKVEAVKYLQAVNTDHKLRDMLAYGIEGKDFKYVNDKKDVIKKDEHSKWTMAAYSEGTFFNMSTESPNTPEKQWGAIKKLNEEAKSSTVVGFSADTSSIKTEIANCQAVTQKYTKELLTGASDPDEVLPRMKSELKSAGLEKVQKELQKQVDARFK